MFYLLLLILLLLHVYMYDYYLFSPHYGITTTNVLVLLFSPANDNVDLIIVITII
jgi:hypothetical protein